jgi:ubiquinone/menaquinone biosynthesis C-methylase UbiE
VANVRFEVIDAQHNPLESASVDGALCRWGFMLMADPDAALRETRRVLREGGRLALATWDTPDRNVWMSAPFIQLVARGAVPPPDPAAPGPFALADLGALARRLADAGFHDVQTGKVEYRHDYDSFEQFWETTNDLAAPVAEALARLDPQLVAEVRDAVRGVLAPFETEGGGLSVPASAVVASAIA